jgi:hypothetical protein
VAGRGWGLRMGVGGGGERERGKRGIVNGRERSRRVKLRLIGRSPKLLKMRTQSVLFDSTILILLKTKQKKSQYSMKA